MPAKPRAKVPERTDLCLWRFKNSKHPTQLVDEAEADTLLLSACGHYLEFEWPSQAQNAEYAAAIIHAAFRQGEDAKAGEIRDVLGVNRLIEEARGYADGR